jgi:Glycosyltransferase Family 4
MKIGYLINTMNPKRGDGRFASDIINEVIYLGHEVVVLKTADDGFIGETILNRGLLVFKNLSKIRKLLNDCDVIHAIDGYPYGVIGWLVNRKLKKKLVISALGTYAVAPLYRWQTSFLLKRAYRSANQVVAISKFTKDKIW